MMKKALHGGACRTTAPTVVADARARHVRAQDAALNHDRAAEIATSRFEATKTTEESFTGGVPKTVKGGFAYWRVGFIQLMAMATLYDAPQALFHMPVASLYCKTHTTSLPFPIDHSSS